MAAGGPPALWAAAAALEPARGGGGGDWRNLVLGLVGETVEGDPGNMITGARVVDKSNGRGQAPTFRLELWLCTKDDKLSAQLKERMLSTITGGSPVRGLAEGFQWKLHA